MSTASGAKFWTQHYSAGVPAEIDTSGYRSVVDLLEQSVQQFRERSAYVCMGKKLSFAEVDAYSRKLAAYLQSVGITQGTRVAIMMPNCLQYPIAIFAVLRMGGIVVNVNPMYTPRELEHQLKDSGAEAIVILENFAHTLQAVIAQTSVKRVIVATLGDLLGIPKGWIVNLVVRKLKKMVPAWELPGHVPFNDAIARGAAANFAKPELTLDDVAFLQYTGGTTGVSKGATLTHGNIVANTLQCDAWFQPALGKLEGQAHMVVALPLYHIFALTVCGMVGMRIGAMCVLIVNPRDIGQFIKDISKQHVSMLPAVNTLFNALMNHPDFKKMDWSSLKVSMGGGMAVQGPVAERWYQLTGCPIVEGYGLSETSPVVTANLIDSTKFTGTIGVPLPSTEVAILDDDGKAVAIGVAGEIAIRGPQVMRGYWNRPDETARSMTPEGFFKTGDVGIMDERGFTKIVDRKKDMILVSGFNVYPNEVEEVIAGCPGVSEVAAIGVPDEHSGEAVKVFVVRKDPSLTEADIKKFAEQGLTGYKKPRHIEFRDDLPKTNVGKILRRALRNEELGKEPKSS